MLNFLFVPIVNCPTCQNSNSGWYRGPSKIYPTNKGDDRAEGSNECKHWSQTFVLCGFRGHKIKSWIS